jgi:hypothetical protein
LSNIAANCDVLYQDEISTTYVALPKGAKGAGMSGSVDLACVIENEKYRSLITKSPVDKQQRDLAILSNTRSKALSAASPTRINTAL